MTGPIFVSHSSQDRADVNALTDALRAAFRDRLRTFNTSSPAAVDVGADWRNQLLAALESASVVILWATDTALQSKEVAFEIGAASAFGQEIVPCCVHISPEMLPWGLSERQALKLDNEEGWIQLAEQVAAIINFPGSLDLEPVTNLSRRFEAPSDALAVNVLGYTIEFENRSKSLIAEIRIQPVDDLPLPEWAAALENTGLNPEQSAVVFREHDGAARELVFSWTDVTGATRQRRISIPPINNEDNEDSGDISG